MRDERGFAIIAAALLVALSIFFGIGAAVVIEHSRMVEGAARAQQLQLIRSREYLSVRVLNEENFEVANRGSSPSVLSAFLVRSESGISVSYAEGYLGAFQSRIFTRQDVGLDNLLEYRENIGVMTQLGNTFWPLVLQ
jgi:hypothetical protein